MMKARSALGGSALTVRVVVRDGLAPGSAPERTCDPTDVSAAPCAATFGGPLRQNRARVGWPRDREIGGGLVDREGPVVAAMSPQAS